MARAVVQLLVKVALAGPAIAIAGLALVGVAGRGPSPGLVVERVYAALAVVPCRVVLAAAHQLPIATGARVTCLGVPVALAPSSHGEVCDGVVVGAQHLLVAEDLVSECVQSSQHDPDGRRGHPLL
uniref:Putative secreted protein n=1 Tax=Ixodes ricinus TaxID=34613 RepID=A0A6B0UQV0_IXORI